MQADIGQDPTRTRVVDSESGGYMLPSVPRRSAVMPNGMKSSSQSDANGRYPGLDHDLDKSAVSKG